MLYACDAGCFEDCGIFSGHHVFRNLYRNCKWDTLLSNQCASNHSLDVVKPPGLSSSVLMCPLVTPRFTPERWSPICDTKAHTVQSTGHPLVAPRPTPEHWSPISDAKAHTVQSTGHTLVAPKPTPEHWSPISDAKATLSRALVTH